MFNPQPKPVKQEKKTKKYSHKNSFLCSNGERVTESQIKALLTLSYKEKHCGEPTPKCEGCGNGKADDNSHIIAKSRLKQLGKTELIWDQQAYCSYCRDCHVSWESWKSGEYRKLNNIEYVLEFLQQHDQEMYEKLK